MKYYYRYLPISEDIRTRSLYVIAGGYTVIPPNTPYPPLQHPSDHHFRWSKGRTLQEYQLIYITRGEGVFETKAGGVRKITAGQLFVLFPGVWHRYHPDKNRGWDEYYVAFNGKYAEEFLRESQITSDNPVIDVGSDETLVAEYLRLIDEIRLEQIGYQSMIAAQTMQIIAHATAASLRRGFEGTEILGVIQRAKCIMLEQFDRSVNIKQVCKDLGVGYSWFRRMFKEYTGLSPAQYHLHLRINRACELLRNTTMPIADIGAATGFSSAYYFSSSFRQKMGCAPREYRSMVQDKVEG